MKIFLSYRRKANVQRAMNLASILQENFGRDNVFLDTNDIESGAEFPKTILGKLEQSQLVLALISPEWLSAVDADYRRRIDSDKDWVHIELRTALERNLRVIPVYVGGTGPLKAEQFPEPLRKLASLQYRELRDDHQWKGDIAALIGGIGGNKVEEGEVRWPKGAPRYLPDPVGPLKLQDLMKELPDWELREFEVDGGPYKGSRGAEIKRVFQFKRFAEAIDFMSEAKDGFAALRHHPRWENIFRDVIVRLTGWDIGHKISDRDYIAAKYLDGLYQRYIKRWESQEGTSKN
jgi:pterin-4a-carbinolamine dehydratase